VSVTDDENAGLVATVVLDLPVGEPSPAIRVHQIAFNMRAALQDRHTVGARRLAGLAGFAPPTLHAVGARMAAGLSHRMFNLLVTNAPGPQQPRYLAGARLVEAYPVAPLTKGQALSIGVTSYDGQVFFGLFADRDALPDRYSTKPRVETSLVIELLAPRRDDSPSRGTAERRSLPHPSSRFRPRVA
jgi:hypothetical protein